MDKSYTGNDVLHDAVTRHADMVVRIAFHHLRNQADAEDITQEVFLKLLQKPGFHDDEHMKAWLIQVTINQCKNHRKSFWQRNTEGLTVDWQAFDTEQQSMLDELFKLPPHYRNVIYLHYYEGYTLAEIARILNRNVNTVGSWLGRAKKKLKVFLIEGGYHYE